MQFRILGPMEIESDDGHVHTLTRRQERALLAILLLNPGQLMPVDRLRNLLWDDPPDQARTAIHVHVSRVRGALARAGSPELSTALVSRRGGYLLDVDPDTVDAHRFRRLLGAAKQAADLTARDALLRDALSLWRGRALANAAATDRLRQRLCADLDELYLHANEEALATGLALGRHREILSDLARQCAEHPARQRLIELHMLALHRDGRRPFGMVAMCSGLAARRWCTAQRGRCAGDSARALQRGELGEQPPVGAPTSRVAAGVRAVRTARTGR